MIHVPLMLCASLAGAPSPGSSLSVAPPAADPDAGGTRPWTLMIYGAADNNADGPILEFLDGVRRALDDDPGMELILFIDRSEGYSDDATLLGEDFTGARVYRLRSDHAELLDAGEFFPGMLPGEEFEVDSADPENIGRFVAFGKARFPAQRYGLMIYSHADGCTMCPDEESGNDMHIPQLTDWVDASASVDFLALELCNMGGLEIAYQWRPENGGFSAEVLVAIPNAGPPLDWDRAFARIRSEGHAAPIEASRGAGEVPPLLDPARMTALEFGRLVVEEGHEGRQATVREHPEMAHHVAREAAACYDLSRAAAAKRALDAFAVELASVADARAILEDLRDGAAEDQGVVMNYMGGEFLTRPYADLYALLERAARSAWLPESGRAAARAAGEAVDALVVQSFGMHGLEGFVPGKHGIFIAFPDGDRVLKTSLGPRSVWDAFGWYTPLATEHREDGTYGRWALLADGATPGNGKVENWFELLDAWFDDTSRSPEGANGYAP